VKVLKKIGDVILKIIIGFLAVVVAYFIIAVITAIIPVNRKFKNQISDNKIWVSSNGVHVNLIVPVQSGTNDWNEFLKTDQFCKYMVFGWGDKEFYMNTPTWAELKFGTAFNALFVPTDAVMQIYCFEYEPVISKNTKRIYLTNEQYDKIIDYIYQSFDIEEEGRPIELIPEKGTDNLYKYYKAKGKYTLFFTCNNWAGRGLKRAGVKNALWAPFDKSVLFHLK
jgi:uncharacterized protein (TIGR02117 family)